MTIAVMDKRLITVGRNNRVASEPVQADKQLMYPMCLERQEKAVVD